MATVGNRSWQFSLRTLLLVMVACAAFLGVGKLVGSDWMFWVSFALLLLATTVMRTKSSRAAWLGALAAVYGPFVMMAMYTLFFISCSHCKAATWSVLPYGPGMIPVELVRHWLDIGRLDDVNWFGIAFIFTAILVFSLAWVLRSRGIWWQATSVVGVVAMSSLGAFIVLALIRA